MNAATAIPHVRETIAAEHEELDALFQRMRKFLAKRPSHLAMMAIHFGELAELLRKHFAHEEEGGYFSELLEIAPQLFDKVEGLRHEHQILFETAEQLAHDVNYAKDVDVWRYAIYLDLEAFIRRCHEHDAAEKRLVQEAWSRDIGLAD